MFIEIKYSKILRMHSYKFLSLLYYVLTLSVISIYSSHAQSQQVSVTHLGTNSITFSSITDESLTAIELSNEGQTIAIKRSDFEQEIVVDGLEPGTIYNVNIVDKNEVIIETFPVVTKSLSSGEIKIYFNRDTDESFSNGAIANGESADIMEDAIIEIIDGAQHTLSICTYNTNRENIVDALRRAHNRGVEVRLITDVDRNNFGLANNIPFPILRGSLGDGIMHNKFIIIDADYDDLAWVQTGSVNYTDFQMTVDPNHAIFIQDKALAQVYLTEFNEMWGSSGLTPNVSNSKFGPDKSDNTPHLVNINGIEIESYFSPSDNTDAYIIDKIDAAVDEIDVAMLIFTRWELRDAIIAAHNRGVLIKVLIEDQENSQGVLDRFDQAGLTTYYIDNESTLMHHKYAIIDEGSTTGEAYTITGSQNWTYSGNTFNDENTLIIKDATIANIYRQEFQSLWKGIATSSESVTDIDDALEVIVSQGELVINTNLPYEAVIVSSINGQQVRILNNVNDNINVSNMPQGLYVVTIRHGNTYHSSKVFID